MVLGLTSHNAALVTAGSGFHRILLPLCLSAFPQISVILENSSWHLIHSLSPASEGWGFGGGDALSAPSWCSGQRRDSVVRAHGLQLEGGPVPLAQQPAARQQRCAGARVQAKSMVAGVHV